MHFSFSLAAAFAFSTLLSAQTVLPPVFLPSPTPNITELKQYLNLTDSQVTSLANIVQQKALAQQQVSSQIAQKNLALQTLLSSASPNPATVGQMVIDIQNLEKQLTPSAEPYHSQALAVLTSSQTTLLGNLSTALQLQTPACEAVNLNLLLLPSAALINGIASSVSVSAGCPSLVSTIVPVFTPGGPVLTLPGGVIPALPPGQ